MASEDLFRENIETNSKEIHEKKTTLFSKPIKLNVALTTRCNLSCRMCEPKKINWEMPVDIIKEIISLFPYLQEVIWQGGEVFLVDYFKELLKEASKYQNLTHEITTNGHLINEEWIEIFNKINLNLNISIDGITKETYEFIRKGSSFLELSNILKLINENRNNIQAKKFFLVLVVTVMKSNYKQLDMFVDFAKSHQFDRLILQPVKGNYDNEENIFYRNDRDSLVYIDGIRKKLKEKANACGIELKECLPTNPVFKNNNPNNEIKKALNFNREKEVPFCYAPWREMFVEWGGNVFPNCLCIQDGPNEARAIGSVLGQTLFEIWNCNKMQNFRKKLIDNNHFDLCNPACLSGVLSDLFDRPSKKL